jgi:hypothetical protein
VKHFVCLGLMLLIITGCHKKVPVGAPVVAHTDKYVITQESQDFYLIRATSFKEAERAAETQLNCAKQICLITNDSVIVSVQKLNKSGK